MVMQIFKKRCIIYKYALDSLQNLLKHILGKKKADKCKDLLKGYEYLDSQDLLSSLSLGFQDERFHQNISSMKDNHQASLFTDY